jgi:hypothetical protein
MKNRELVLVALVVLAAALALACFSSGDDDDDDDRAAGGVDCNPDFCNGLTEAAQCDALADEDMRNACGYCLRGSLADEQIAQCIADNRDKATGDALEEQCIIRVEEFCALAELG